MFTSASIVVPVSRASSASRSRNSPRRRRAGAGQPAARAFQPALLRILVEDLAAVDLADEHALRPGQRVRVLAELGVELEQARTSSAPAAITFGSSGRITSWTGGPGRRMVAFQVKPPRPMTGSSR